MSDYRPRRCSKRWLDGDCPPEVLAVMDNRGESCDRYVVFYTPVETHGCDAYIGYRAMSAHPQSPIGFGVYDIMRAHEVAAYRYRFKHQYATWSSLPPDVKATVRRDCEAIRQALKEEQGTT